jgi:hypothetical protein
VAAYPTHLECLEPDGRKLKYRTATVLASLELQARCTQKRVLKRLLAGSKSDVSKARVKSGSAPLTGFRVISKIGLLVLPSLAVFGIRAMMTGKKSNRE